MTTATPTAWQMAETTASRIMHQRYPGGAAHIRLDLTGGQATDNAADDFLDRCRRTLDADPATLAYRRAVEQAQAARDALDRINSETADAQSKREELLASLPPTPTEKQLAAAATADRKAESLKARCDDATHALRLLHRRAAEARAAVEQAAERIGRQTLASLRREVQSRWDEAVAKIPAALAPLLDTLLSLDAAQGALMSDGRAGQAALLAHELPALPDLPGEPVEVVGDDGDDEQDVLPLASAG